MLIKVSVTMLVANAARGGIPNESIAGTVTRAVPPVITVTKQVRKKIAARAIK
jgi:hypothetical protein